MQAKQEDIAPIDRYVIQQFAPSNASDAAALSIVLYQRLDEVAGILDQISQGSGGLSDSQRMLLEGTLNELGVVRTEMRTQFEKNRAVSMSSTQTPKAWDHQTADLNRKFESIYQAIQNITETHNPKQQKSALAKARTEVGRLLESARERNNAALVGKAAIVEQGMRAAQKPEVIRDRSPAPAPEYLSYQKKNESTGLYAFRGRRPSDATRSGGLMYASNTGNEMVLAALPGPVPTEAVTTCAYTGADLAATVDAQITPEIQALAEKLSYSPAKIYEYVINEIKFEPYFGSLKGSMGTLYSKAGGPTDHASLLIALLRASNIPARYIQGNVKFVDDDARFLRWVGAKGYNAAAAILIRGGYPYVLPTVLASGKTTVEIAHVWVEACVPYSNYRGAQADTTGNRWVPMDASFKDKAYQSGIVTDAAFDYQGYMSKRSLDLPHEQFDRQVAASIKSQPPRYSNNTLQDVPYSGIQVPRMIDILPVTLPYITQYFTAWTSGGLAATADLPDSHRVKFNITIKNGTGANLTSALSLTLPQVALNRITLSFKGATTADQTALDAWRLNGDMSGALPAGTVNVVPVIKVEGVDKLVGATPVALTAADIKVDMGVTLAEGNSVYPPQQGSAVVSASAYYALQGYAFQASDRLLTERAAKLLASVTAVANPNNDLESTLGEYLHLMGLKGLRYVMDANKRIGELMGGTGLNGNILALVGTQMKVQYLLDVPYAVSRTGYEVQMPFMQIRHVSVTTGLPSWEAFRLMSYSADAFSSYIFQENAQLDSMNAARGIQYANEIGIPVLNISSGNQATELPKLSVNYTAAQKTEIAAQLSQGLILTVPTDLVNYQGQVGAVWIAEKKDLTSFLIGFIRGGGSANAGGSGSVGAIQGYKYVSITQGGFNYSSSTTTVAGAGGPIEINSGVGPGVSPYTALSAGMVNLATGNKFQPERDISIKGRGELPLIFERSYNSRGVKDGPLGFGWTHNFNQTLKFNDPSISGVSVDGLTSTVNWVDGSGASKYIDAFGTSTGVAIGSPMSPPNGFYFQTSRNPDGTYSIREKNGLTYTFENKAGVINEVAKLIKISDRNGNALRVNYTGALLTSVTDDLNRSLVFTYTGSRITQITDWAGRTHQYAYDALGDLISYKNPLAVAGTQPPLTYTYFTGTAGTVSGNLAHAMKSYTLPRGNGMTYEYYPNGKIFRHTNTQGQSMTYTYNDFRRETVVVNERGLTRRTLLSVDGMPLRTVDENGGEHVNVYNSPSNPLQKVSSISPLGYTTSYSYDGLGNVTQVNNPSNNTLAFSYFNAFNQPGRIKDARGNYTLIKYDAKGNLLEEIKLKTGFGASLDPTTYTPVPAQILSWTINTYDTVGNTLIAKKVRDFTTQAGPTVEYSYNDTVNNVQGLNAVSLTRRGDKNGDGTIAPTEFDTANLTYDALGRVTLGITDAWYPTQFVYNALDRVIRSTDANGKLRDYEFDANGNPKRQSLTIASTLLDQATTSYDLSDRKITSTDNAGFITQYAYDAAGNVIKTTNPDNQSIGFAYDAANRVIMAYDEESHAVLKTLDLDGKPRAITDANNITSQSEYYGPERDGRLKTQTDALGRKTTYDYDAHGNTVSVTDNLGRITLTTYDELNRPVRMVGPVYTDSSTLSLGAIRPVTRNTYDPLGNLAKVDAGRTDASGSNAAADVVVTQMSYAFDDFGRKLKETDALAKAWLFEYDLNSNVIKATDPKSQIITATYTYGGILTTQSAHKFLGDPAPQVTTYTRNNLGQITQAQSPAVTYSYAYTTAQRLESVTDSRGAKTFTFTYTYSNAGRLKRLQDSEGKRTDYLYDPVGRLTGLWAANNDLITFLRDRGGRLTEKWFPSGVNTRYAYNDDNTLQQIVNRLTGSSGAVISQNEYTYDGVGNRKTATEKAGSTTTPVTSEAYGYDPLGNRSYKSDTTGATFYYSYDTANQLKDVRTGSASGTLTGTLVYDANGNVIQKCEGGTVTATTTSCTGTTVSTLTYDVYNRLTQVQKTGIATQTYQYDDQGRRISKTVGTATTNYLYNGDNLYAEYSSWTTPLAGYTHGPGTDDQLIRTTPTASQYYHKDGLGSVVALTDTSGATLGTQLYDAWGNKLAVTSSGSIAQYGYTGREPDETGFIYYRARYYDPSVGRFTQRDPSGFGGGLNLYAYVNGSPTNLTDPTGLAPWDGWDPDWAGVGKGALSLGNNLLGVAAGTFGVTTGVGLMMVPSPGVSQAAGAFTFGIGAATFLDSGAGIPANFMNIGNALAGTPSAYPDSGSKQIANYFAPGDSMAMGTADIFGLGLAFAGGRMAVGSRLIPGSQGSALPQYGPANINQFLDEAAASTAPSFVTRWSSAPTSTASHILNLFGGSQALSTGVDYGSRAYGSLSGSSNNFTPPSIGPTFSSMSGSSSGSAYNGAPDWSSFSSGVDPFGP